MAKVGEAARSIAVGERDGGPACFKGLLNADFEARGSRGGGGLRHLHEILVGVEEFAWVLRTRILRCA